MGFIPPPLFSLLSDNFLLQLGHRGRGGVRATPPPTLVPPAPKNMPLSSRRCRPHTTQRTGLQQYKSTNRGPSRGRRARCTADMLHTSTENVNTSLDDPKSVTSHVSNVGFYRKIKKSKKKIIFIRPVLQHKVQPSIFIFHGRIFRS